MIDLIGKKVKYERYNDKKMGYEVQCGTLVRFGVKTSNVHGINYTYTTAIILLPDGSFANIDIENISLVDPLGNENE